MSNQTMQPKFLPPITSLICISNTLLFQPLSLLITHYLVFLLIFLFLALPLSILFSSLYSSSHPIKSHILQLHSLASFSPTQFEARQVWKESREDAISLMHLKLIYFVPCFLLSLAAAVTTISSATAGFNHRLVTIGLAFSAIKSNWVSPIVTSICSYIVLVVYSGIPRALAAMVGNGIPGLVVRVVGSSMELYLMAVIGMAMVISIVEERIGWDALLTGSCLMEGKQISGSLLAGLLALATATIRWRMEVLLDKEGVVWARVSGLVVEAQENERRRWEWVGLVALYGVLVIWGYIVITVFYCECKKQQVVSRDVSEDDFEL